MLQQDVEPKKAWFTMYTSESQTTVATTRTGKLPTHFLSIRRMSQLGHLKKRAKTNRRASASITLSNRRGYVNMPDKFTLLTFGFCFILHNVCSWTVSEPLDHTFNEDDSVSVTCTIYANETFQVEAKLKMNGKYVCEVYNKSQVQDTSKINCKWHREGNKFTFTLMKPEGLHKNEFSCEISKVKPFPIEREEGPKTKLFRGCNKSLASLKSSCPFTNQTDNQNHTPVKRDTPEEIYTLLICSLIIVVVLLCVYSMIITAFYIRLREKKPESLDTLTYVPMQRNVKRHDLENTEYVDMREVQKQGGSHRDMNHNSHLA
ncbi:uncharacterized protein si:ch211-67e16.3 isoform X2 [Puntigrus tetrazona]|uniref:uncharacterized protein si:ch211-67e16.3 isoform X2 n=1 Tax=Puntigrus tetrazona TaxID=1606681 RepID=UPI001C8931EF|nr:uncharacterized protein si:ch211-67e16.3 isoform X2 [Puntigrus tetrazona]